MKKCRMALVAIVFLVAGAALAADSAAVAALKGRTTVPAAAAMDRTVTLEGLLAKSAPTAWSTDKAATIEGYVIQVVKSDDGDYRLSLAAKAGEVDSKKWVIVEATPDWMKKEPSLAEAKLAARTLIGKKVQATGWLFHDDTKVSFPRGTNWELHPLTSLVIPEK